MILVPGQPLSFRAEPESETSILLSWAPPRSDSIANYELVYKDGEHGEEVRLLLNYLLYQALLYFCILFSVLKKGQIIIEYFDIKGILINRNT